MAASRSIKNKHREPRQMKSPSMAPLPTSSRKRKPRTLATVSAILAVLLVISVICLLLVSSNAWRAFQQVVSYETISVVNEFPHDPQAFTQGLLYAGNDTLYESTGLYKKSSVRKVALRTGKVEKLQKLDDSIFGEGLTLLSNRFVKWELPTNHKPLLDHITLHSMGSNSGRPYGSWLIQVTWLQTLGFTYDLKNLSKLGTFNHDMKDGWGLATDGKVLFGSDGSSTLYKIDPQTFKVISKHVVFYKGHQVHNLNELEYINGEVWANVFMTDCIAKISPKDGVVVGWIFLPNLRKELMEAGNSVDVLNGIAWDAEQERIFVTGKLWPKLYEIKVLPIKSTIEEGMVEQLCLRKPFEFL